MLRAGPPIWTTRTTSPYFVAEELQDARIAFHRCVLDLLPGNGVGFVDPGIDEVLDLGDLRRRERLRIEVETQAVGTDIGPLLGDLGADNLVEGPVQQVGGGMVAFDGEAARWVDFDGDLLACFQRLGGEQTEGSAGGGSAEDLDTGSIFEGKGSSVGRPGRLSRRRGGF